MLCLPASWTVTTRGRAPAAGEGRAGRAEAIRNVLRNPGNTWGARGLQSGLGSLLGSLPAPDPVIPNLLVWSVMQGGQLLALASTVLPQPGYNPVAILGVLP